MDAEFYVCIATRGTVGARVWEVCVFRHAYGMCLCLVCIMWQFSMLNSAWQFVNGYKRRPYDYLIGSHECVLLFTPSGCGECFFFICSGLYACTEMLWICVLYVTIGSKVRPRTFVCVSMGSTVLFILRSRLLLYSAVSGVNRVQVVLSGFSVRCRYGCMYFLAALVLVCEDVMVISSA